MGKSCCSNEPVGRINVRRFIEKLDSFLKKNDMEGAGECILYWENEARNCNDLRGLLSIINEELGYYRRMSDGEKAEKAAEEAVNLLNELDFFSSPSGAVILVNAATTLSAFGNYEKALKLYGDAEKSIENKKSFEFATLLNNKSSAFRGLKRYTEAEENLQKAVEILKPFGDRDAEIALSILSIAEIRAETGRGNEVEALLSEAWDYLNSETQPHDGNYAYILTKCAPIYGHFGKEDEENALNEVAEEIYEGN